MLFCVSTTVRAPRVSVANWRERTNELMDQELQRTKKRCPVAIASNKSQRKTWGQPPREDELDHTDGSCSIYFYFIYFMLMSRACNIRVLVGEF